MAESEQLFMVLCAALSIYACLSLQNGCRLSQLDAKMKPLSSLGAEAKWPSGEQSMDKMCSGLTKDIVEMRDYMKRCVRAEAKTAIGVSVHTMDRIAKVYCKNRNERKKMLATSRCANAGSRSVSKCWTDNISRVTAINNVTISKDKIPLLCCSTLRWKDCFMKTYEDIGPPLCSSDDIEVLDQYSYKSTVEPLNVVCGDLDDSDKCKRFEAFMAKSWPKRAKYSTPFPAIIEIFENL